MRAAGLVSFLLLAALSAASSSIDLTQDWRFKADPENAGLDARWFEPEHADGDWASVSAGLRWEDQGFPDVDGVGWYRRHVEIPASWEGGRVWFTAAAVNDAGQVFCNGQPVGSYGDEREGGVCFASLPLVADLTPHVRFGGDNVLAVRAMDWGGSGGLWRVPCRVTNDPAQLPEAPGFHGYTDLEAERFVLDVDLVSLGSGRPDSTLLVEMRAGGDEPAPVRVNVPAGKMSAELEIPVPGVGEGKSYEVRVALQDEQGNDIGAPAKPMQAGQAAMPSWPGEYVGLKVLNSLVTELYSGRFEKGEATFLNPREGWVYIGIEPSGPLSGPPLQGRLDDQAEPFVFRYGPDGLREEAMVFVKEGRHTLRMLIPIDDVVRIRAVPELAYCYYLANPHLAPYGPYDRAFLERHVMPHVNTLVTSGVPAEEDLRQWASQGRRWVANASLPGLTAPEAPAAEDVYRAWIGAPGVDHSAYGGLIVDEFITASPAHYAAWAEAMEKTCDDARFAGKTFYAFCGDLHEDAHSLDFAKRLLARNGLFALERYIAEEPSEDIARRWQQRQLPGSLREWQAALPGVERRFVFVLGFMSAPPESLDTLPTVDYNVLHEMQFNLLANDPASFGLYGLMEYSASYADEESVRWAHRLMRHYCIEGRRDRLSKDPYILGHVANPDFAEGSAGWAAEGSVATKTMEGLSWLQGRYPRTAAGDTYLSMTRSTERPNRVRQVLTGLEPGRTYSLKLFAVAPQELERNQDLALSVKLEGAEILEPQSFRYTYPSNYAHELGPYNRDHPAYINYFRLVFRAGEGPVELAISDWSGPEAAGGPSGQEVGVNFVQVQPYRMP